MRIRSVVSALAAAGLSLAASSLQAQSASISATATVQSAITYADIAPLAFGNVTPGVNRTVNPADLGAGSVNIGKATGQSIGVSFTLPANLVGPGGATLPISGWNGVWNTVAGAAGGTNFTPAATATLVGTAAASNVWLYLGATVSPAAAQTAGAYSGTITVQATYF